MSQRFFIIVGLLGLAFAALPAPQAGAQFSTSDVMAHAIQTVNDLKRHPAFGNARQLIQRARGVLIVPRLYKTGFFFGGSGGEGVLLARRGPGSWSDPAFFYIASASFGLQIGAQQSEMVLIADQQPNRVALAGDVGVHRLSPAHGLLAACSHHHGLGVTAQQVRHIRSEVFHLRGGPTVSPPPERGQGNGSFL